jgi:hypothetical protein
LKDPPRSRIVTRKQGIRTMEGGRYGENGFFMNEY